MKDGMFVFMFKVWYNEEFDVDEPYQVRYVVASNKEEACKKLNEFRKELVSAGFADFKHISEPSVEVENVIY